jgi:metallo-beta-lactamase family protein
LMLEYQGKRLLLDCGYDDSLPSIQGPPLHPIRPDSIDAVVLSHGHLGHCGLLPILVREGFTGKVYCPKKAAEIAIASMLEAALMQDEEAKYWKGKMPQNAIEPVYSEDEVLRCSYQ